MNFKYKQDNDFQTRKDQSNKIKEKWPERIPVICEKDPKSNIPNISKTNYLVPYDMPIHQFSFTIKKRLELSAETALFLLVGGKTSIAGNQTMGQVYLEHQDEDGFLYITYASENIWG